MRIFQYIRKHLNILLPLFILTVVTLAVWLPRIGVPMEMDDTLGVVGGAYSLVHGADPATLTAIPNKGEIIWNTFRTIWADSGNRFAPYRPMNNFITMTELFWPYSPIWPTLINALILGLTAMVLYLLIYEVTKKLWVAFVAPILFAIANTSIGLTWYVLHDQIYLNLFIVFGIYCYIRYVKNRRIIWFILMVITCFIAPYFRELMVILPLTILFTMLVERKWDKKLLIALPLLVLNSWFPSFLPNLLFYGHVIIQSQYRGAFVMIYSPDLGPIIQNLISRYTTTGFTAPYVIALSISPIFTVLALMGIISFLRNDRKTLVNAAKKRPWLVLLAIIFIIVLVGIIIRVGWGPMKASNTNHLALLLGYILSPLFFILMIFTSLKLNKLFSIWLLVSGGLFMLIYIGYDAHLWPAMLPYAVIALLWIDYLYSSIKQWIANIKLQQRKLKGKSKRRSAKTKPRQWVAPAIRGIVVCMFVIGIVDQCLNVYAESVTWHEIGGKMQSIGQSLMSAPQDSMVVTNLYQGADIEYFDHSRVQHYNTFPWVGYIPGRDLENRLDFEIAVNSHFPDKNVYILAELLHNTNPYVTDPPGTLTLLKHYDVYCRYYYIDPFRILLPHQLWANACASELRAPYPLQGGPFYREYHQEYDLYQLVNYVPRTVIAKTDVKGLDIYFYDGSYYSIPHGQAQPEIYIKGIIAGTEPGNTNKTLDGLLNSITSS